MKAFAFIYGDKKRIVLPAKAHGAGPKIVLAGRGRFKSENSAFATPTLDTEDIQTGGCFLCRRNRH